MAKSSDKSSEKKHDHPGGAAHDHPGGAAHDRSHTHTVTPAQATSKAFLIGIGLNLVYVIAEAIAGIWTDSLALLTDAGHNLSDVASLGLSLFAFKLAKVPARQSFTYGYKKTTVLAALANAVILLIAIGVLAIETIRRIGHPQPLEGGVIAWVAAIGIVVNGLSAMLFFKQQNELNSRGAYLHLISDAIVSAGVVVAGIVISYTGWYWLDTIVSGVVLIVILISTWSLLTDSLRLSMDGVPKSIDPEKAIAAIIAQAGVNAVFHVHIWAISTTENALTAQVVLDGSVDQQKAIANIKHELEHHDIQHATIEITRPDAMPKGEPCKLND